THSICTLEFEDHRPLYDWFIQQLEINHPQQIEFARLNLTYTVMSKRMLAGLVQNKYVNGWDDPRMPTISGMRRRGYSPQTIRNFCSAIGVSKAESMVDIAFLEHFIREDLNKRAQRVMAVINPLKVIIVNYPDSKEEELTAINNPEDPSAGTRALPFSKILYIEKDDFMEEPHQKFYRLAPDREVRLRYAYFIKCVDAVKDKNGNILELHCTYDPLTRGGNSPDKRKVKSTLHWVSAGHCMEAEVRLYDKLFIKENPLNLEEGLDFKDNINPDSLKVVNNCKIEPSLAGAKPGEIYQFERLGYFCVDPDSKGKKKVFNRTAILKDEWAKIKSAKL
ncbi:MAG: glutamine--tRNA ligase, partial [Actinobacteria bacterium]|nr:glutamine--tRNA ligase [Actinomycetota bacterium]